MDDQKPNIYKQLRKLISRRSGDISNQIIATAANLDNAIRGRIGEAEDVIDGDAQRRQELLKEFIFGEAAGIQAKIDQMAARQSQSIVEAISAMEVTVADNLKDALGKVNVDKVKDLERSVAELKTIAQRNEDNLQGILGLMHSMAKAVKQLEEHKTEKE